MSRKSTIRIGNASGYWGDDPDALTRQAFGKYKLDYITMDFLAEITMSIMQKQRSKDPQAGYARDFIPMMEAVFKKILSDGTKIITNAGGINPESCALALQDLARKLGLKPRIAVVYGDDILKEIPSLIDQGIEFKNMESGRLLGEHKNQMLAANVYFGALPVARALTEWNPDIVITGRVTDTGITLGAMIHEFGWVLDDYDRLASGIVAGHLIECGSQATGGNFSDWHKVTNYHNIGYPIIEMKDSGEFVITKHPDTGGLVCVDTIREQLVYEMGDPKAYITPDVVADFSSVELLDDGADRVRVTSIKGMPPTPFFKVSMAYQDGYKCVGEIAISGPKAREKAAMFADIFWSRAGRQFTQTETEFFGLNACHRGLQTSPEAHEIILRLGAQDIDDRKLKKFSKLVPSLILGGPAGVAVLGGAPRVQTIVSYWPALIPKTSVIPKIALLGEQQLGAPIPVPQPMPPMPHGFSSVSKSDIDVAQTPSQPLKSALLPEASSLAVPQGYQRLSLSNICLARSGDKGDSANIGLLARSPEAYDFILKGVSAQKIKDLFQDFCFGSVIRYQVPRILGLNFILENALGGGGTVTLRADAQGKTLAQALLNVEWLIPDEVVRSVQKTDTNR